MSSEKFNEILDFAIAREEEAHRFYLDLAEKMDRPNMKKTFLDFAKEELADKTRLEAVRQGKYDWKGIPEVVDLQIFGLLSV